MICALFARNLTYLISKNLAPLGRSRTSFSLSIIYFSTVRESKSSINPAIYDFLLHKHKFSPTVSSRVASVPSHLANPEKCDSVLSFFKEIGFTKAQLERILWNRPMLLSSSLEKTIKPKIKVFQERDFPAKDIAEIISKESGILFADPSKRIIPSLVLLNGLLGSSREVAKVLRKSSWLLISGLVKHVLPNVELFKSCGVPMNQIVILLKDIPRFFLYKPEIVRRCVDQVGELGVSRSSKMFIYAVGAVGSMTNGKWELKMQDFQNIFGFSEGDILRVLRQNPRVFKISEDKMKEVKEVLLGTGKYETSCIVKCPRSLMFSVEQRYKPRIEVLRILENRHLIKRWPSLGTLCSMTDDKFLKMFVSPYIKEVGDVYLAHRAPNNRRGGNSKPAA